MGKSAYIGRRGSRLERQYGEFSFLNHLVICSPVAREQVLHGFLLLLFERCLTGLAVLLGYVIILDADDVRWINFGSISLLTGHSSIWRFLLPRRVFKKYVDTNLVNTQVLERTDRDDQYQRSPLHQQVRPPG